MTRSIPRLLGYATVGAGVTAAGYVGLVTGACLVDLGIGPACATSPSAPVNLAAALRHHARDPARPLATLGITLG